MKGEGRAAEDYYNRHEPSSIGHAGDGETESNKGKKINLSLLFHKLVADNNPNVRRELCKLCGEQMSIRFTKYRASKKIESSDELNGSAYVTSKGELELPLLLLLLSEMKLRKCRRKLTLL